MEDSFRMQRRFGTERVDPSKTTPEAAGNL
jgi:hypothetical protein